ncbi:hypothetical protein J8J27_31615, partial [Mycobacterium tuberculosis]|nr:hypothetical protein [Mycobacterium tuberculosis]
MKAMTTFCAAIAIVAATASGGAAADLVKVKTAWVAGLEMFPLWYGLNKNWDADEGLEVDYQKYA